MLRAVLPVAAVLGLVLLSHPGQTATITALKSPKVDVPASDAMFPAGPGSDAINNNCLASFGLFIAGGYALSIFIRRNEVTLRRRAEAALSDHSCG